MSGTGHIIARCLCSLRATGQTARHPTQPKDTRPLDNNDHSAHPAATPSEARGWTQILARYRQPSDGRGTVEIGITLVPLVGVVGADLGRARCRLLAVAAARGAGRGLPGAAVHDPARLRPRRLLPPPPGQRLGRPRHRRADADALRLLAPHPRAASRHVGQSRSPRLRRHRYADGARISRRCRSGAGCAIACTGIRWSCSASARPICSSCSTGCRSG